MKSTVMWALIVVNVVLLAGFIGRVMNQNTAWAQNAAQARRPGDYIAVPMDVVGASSGIVVVVDQTNGQLSALSYDDANRRFDTMSRDKVDLQRLFQQTGGGNRQR